MSLVLMLIKCTCMDSNCNWEYTATSVITTNYIVTVGCGPNCKIEW